MTFEDKFNMYSVRFNLCHNLQSTEHAKICGDPMELGAWTEGDGPIDMDKSTEKLIWIGKKKIYPSYKQVYFTQNQEEGPSRISYKYSIRDESNDSTRWEREPSRFLEI